MKLWLIVILSSCVLLTACNRNAGKTNAQSPRTTAPSPTPDEFAATRQVYAKNCALCHADNGEGKTATVDGKRIKAPSLRTGHALHHPDEDFVNQIVKGGDGMPAFSGKLSKQEIDDLVRFIRREFQGK